MKVPSFIETFGAGVPDERYIELAYYYRRQGMSTREVITRLAELQSDYQYFLEEYFDHIELPALMGE